MKIDQIVFDPEVRFAKVEKLKNVNKPESDETQPNTTILVLESAFHEKNVWVYDWKFFKQIGEYFSLLIQIVFVSFAFCHLKVLVSKVLLEIVFNLHQVFSSKHYPRVAKLDLKTFLIDWRNLFDRNFIGPEVCDGSFFYPPFKLQFYDNNFPSIFVFIYSKWQITI